MVSYEDGVVNDLQFHFYYFGNSLILTAFEVSYLESIECILWYNFKLKTLNTIFIQNARKVLFRVSLKVNFWANGTAYIASHFFYSLIIFSREQSWEKVQEWWTGDKGGECVPAGELRESWDSRMSHICFFLVLCPLAVPCAWGFISGNWKALSLVILLYCSIHLPLALLYLPFRKRQRNRDVQPLGSPWAGISPLRHTARLEVVDEVASQCQSLWEAQGVPPALSPVTQQTSLILSCPFLLVSGSSGTLRPYTEIFSWSRTQGKWFPGCLIWVCCHPSLHITVLHICPQSELLSDQGTQTSLKT